MFDKKKKYKNILICNEDNICTEIRNYCEKYNNDKKFSIFERTNESFIAVSYSIDLRIGNLFVLFIIIILFFIYIPYLIK